MLRSKYDGKLSSAAEMAGVMRDTAGVIVTVTADSEGGGAVAPTVTVTVDSEGGAVASTVVGLDQPRDAKILSTIVLAGGFRPRLHLEILWCSDCRLTDAHVYVIALATGTPNTTAYDDIIIEGGV